MTPTLVPLTGDYRLAASDWYSKDADGRVLVTSARPDAVDAAATFFVYSVHGNLPEDEIFHAEFFGERLPRVLAGYVAARILQMFGANDGFLKAYAAAGGLLVNPQDFRVAFERVSSPAIIYPLTREAWDSAVDFNKALCDGPIACDGGYWNAVLAASRARTVTARAAAFTSVIIMSPEGSREETFARAQRGLAMARSLNWAAAIDDLRIAVPQLDRCAPQSVAARRKTFGTCGSTPRPCWRGRWSFWRLLRRGTGADEEGRPGGTTLCDARSARALLRSRLRQVHRAESLR